MSTICFPLTCGPTAALQITSPTAFLSKCSASLLILLSLSSYYLEVKVIQLCLTLCHPMDYTAHGILQARIPEWVTFPFSTGSSQPRDQTQVSYYLTLMLILNRSFGHSVSLYLTNCCFHERALQLENTPRNKDSPGGIIEI